MYQTTLEEMRRFAAIFAGLFLSSELFGATSDLPVFQEQLFAVPRWGEGTTGERESFDAVAKRLDELGIGYERHLLNENTRGHSFSEMLIAVIAGNMSERYALAVPMESGAFAVSLLLEIAGDLAINPPQHTVELHFLGGERGDTPFHPYGSRRAAGSVEDPTGTFVVYIDADHPPRTWRLIIGANGTIAPFWLTRSLLETIRAESISHRLQGTDIHVAKLGFQSDIGPLSAWLEEGVPAISLQGLGEIEPENLGRQTERLVRALLSLDRTVEQVPGNRENTYAYLRLFEGMQPRFVRELPYVVGILIIFALLVTIVLFQSRKVGLNFRRYARYWWTWALLFFVIFLFFFLATLFIEEIGLLADFPDLWTHASGTFVFFKLTIAAALSLIFILIARGLPLPRTPHFYSYTAVVTSGMLTLVFSALDITLASYAIWTTLAFLFFTLSRNPRAKTFSLILALLPYATALRVTVTQPYRAVLDFLLLDRIPGNLVLTLIVLPAILALTSLNYWRTHYNRARRDVITPAATLTLSLAAAVTLVWILRLSPFDAERPQPVTLVDKIDMVHRDRRVLVSSPGPLGRAELLLDGVSYPLDNIGRQAEIRAPLNRTPLEIAGDSRQLLGRRTVRVSVNGEEKPSRLTLQLQSIEPFTVHEATMPFEMASSGTSADIFVGDNPPFPFDIRFTVNGDAELILSATAVWNDPEDPPSGETGRSSGEHQEDHSYRSITLKTSTIVRGVIWRLLKKRSIRREMSFMRKERR